LDKLACRNWRAFIPEAAVSRLDQIIDELIEREGAFVHHEDDKGGPTMYGITEKVARLHHYDGPMRHLPLKTAKAIYRDQYWSVPNYDRVAMLSHKIAEELLDTGVNMGVSIASKMLQRSLNALNDKGTHYGDILADGIIGNGTLGALKSFLDYRGHTGQQVLLKALNCLQGARYIEIAESRERNESFVFGWLAHRVII
jgi:lysozyme family protein